MLYFAFAVLAASGAAQSLAAVPAPVSRLIVKFRADPQKAALAQSARVARLAADAGVALVHVRAMALGMDVVRLDGPRPIAEAQALAARLSASADVEFAEVDLPVHALRVPNDEFLNAQTYLPDGPASIGAFSAWDVTTGSPDVVVAVLDTGIRPHVEFTGRLVPGYDFVSETLRSGDGDGRDGDPSDPGDFVTQADLDAGLTGVNCRPAHSSWHGTSVAGVIAANGNNGQWTAGIDWAAKIEPLRVLGKCGGSTSDVVDAIAWAAGIPVAGTPQNAYPAHVINLSLGAQAGCPASYASAINAALATGRVRAIVAAAGNEAGEIGAPANCPGVISVVSTTTDGHRARYSNFGALATISAPGGRYSPSQPTDGIFALSNAGAQAPGADTITNTGGTSFAAPMVSGSAALVLAAAPDLGADQLRALLTATAKPFPAVSDCTSATCGAGIVDAGNAVRAAVAGGPSASNYEGLWWDSAENGWGINLAHQGDQIYLTWYTYDATGKASWLAMLAQKSTPGVYTGSIIELHGPAFTASPFAPAPTPLTVGTGTLTFSDASNGTFAYTAKSVSQSKSITRYPFAAPAPACTYSGAPDFSSATNYQDLWWDSAENGWGINLAQQGTQIYATWYTYDVDGSPLWFAALMDQSAPGRFSGTLLRVSGPAFGAPWNVAAVAPAAVGLASLAFSSGNAGTWTYSVGALTGVKPITRFLFAAPAGTLCR